MAVHLRKIEEYSQSICDNLPETGDTWPSEYKNNNYLDLPGDFPTIFPKFNTVHKVSDHIGLVGAFDECRAHCLTADKSPVLSYTFEDIKRIFYGCGFRQKVYDLNLKHSSEQQCVSKLDPLIDVVINRGQVVIGHIDNLNRTYVKQSDDIWTKDSANIAREILPSLASLKLGLLQVLNIGSERFSGKYQNLNTFRNGMPNDAFITLSKEWPTFWQRTIDDFRNLQKQIDVFEEELDRLGTSSEIEKWNWGGGADFLATLDPETLAKDCVNDPKPHMINYKLLHRIEMWDPYSRDVVEVRKAGGRPINKRSHHDYFFETAFLNWVLPVDDGKANWRETGVSTIRYGGAGETYKHWERPPGWDVFGTHKVNIAANCHKNKVHYSKDLKELDKFLDYSCDPLDPRVLTLFKAVVRIRLVVLALQPKYKKREVAKKRLESLIYINDSLPSLYYNAKSLYSSTEDVEKVYFDHSHGFIKLHTDLMTNISSVYASLLYDLSSDEFWDYLNNTKLLLNDIEKLRRETK